MKKNILLALTALGFVLPNLFVLRASMETGNILLYRYPMQTFELMFANDVSSAFAVDLLFVVFLFLFWTYREGQRLGMRHLWGVWVFTFAFGIASGLPLFLWLREKRLDKNNDPSSESLSL